MRIRDSVIESGRSSGQRRLSVAYQISTFDNIQALNKMETFLHSRTKRSSYRFLQRQMISTTNPTNDL